MFGGFGSLTGTNNYLYSKFYMGFLDGDMRKKIAAGF
jgi:hypothetical protein